MKSADEKKPRKPLNGPFNDLISKRMRELGVDRLEDFAEAVDMPRATLYTLARGRVSPNGTFVKPSVDTLVALSKALQRPLHELIYILEPDAPGADALMPSSLKRLAVRKAGWVGAGPDEYEEILDEFVWVDEQLAAGRDLLAFRVRGDSMEGGPRPILDGDLVLVDRNDKGRDNSAVVARLRSDGYVCKLMKEDKFGLHLVSQNPRYTNGTPPYIAPQEIAEIVGRVIEVRRPEVE